MEELSIEEKAKRYDEAIEKLRDFYRDYDTVSLLINVKEELANIFPELKEGEDERVRRELIEQVIYIAPNNDEVDSEGNVLPTYQKRIDKYIAWLEKQGEQKQELLTKEKALKNSPFVEQKPADKVEPKFKVGDKIQYKKYIYTIKEVQEDCYVLDDDKVLTFNAQDVWGLVEQKPVDLVAILKDYFANTPKEQQDKDWEELKHLNNFGWELVEQEPVLSEEDENWLIDAINVCELYGYNETAGWLKNRLKFLKERVQTKQEWSEEDKRSIRDSIFYLKSAKKYFEKDDDILWDEKWFNLCIEWLESLYKKLRLQSQWKPSDEQMDALETAVSSLQSTALESLYNKLKKL